MPEAEEQENASSERPERPRSINSSRIRFLVLFIVFGGLLTWTNLYWKSVRRNLTAKTASLETEIGAAKADLENAKAELNKCRELSQQKGTPSTGTPDTSDTQAVNPEPSAGKETDRVRVTVEPSSPANVWGGELQISLIDAPRISKGSKYIVHANVISPGYATMQIDLEAGNNTVTYRAKKLFNIRVLSADAARAIFVITRH